MAQLTQMDALGALVWALDTFEKPPSERAGGRGSSMDMDILLESLSTLYEFERNYLRKKLRQNFLIIYFCGLYC